MMLNLQNIYKTYYQGRMEVPVLNNVSLCVEKGEYVAIMGPSGSGKTTLMNIIGCLDMPTQGRYFLDNNDITNNNDKKLSDIRLRSIGFVFQSFYLLSRQSAIENVALPLLYAGVPKKRRLDIARNALERVGLGDRLDFKPTQLSGGQCQRVAIARAIINNPKIVLADEPTGALDTSSGEQIMEIFKSLNNDGVTVIMITHEPEIAAYAKKVYRIRDGRFVDEYGNPTDTTSYPPPPGGGPDGDYPPPASPYNPEAAADNYVSAGVQEAIPLPPEAESNAPSVNSQIKTKKVKNASKAGSTAKHHQVNASKRQRTDNRNIKPNKEPKSAVITAPAKKQNYNRPIHVDVKIDIKNKGTAQKDRQEIESEQLSGDFAQPIKTDLSGFFEVDLKKMVQVKEVPD